MVRSTASRCNSAPLTPSQMSALGSGAIQTFVRVREQTFSNLIGQHVQGGASAVVDAATQLAGPFGSRPTGIGDPAPECLSRARAGLNRRRVLRQRN